GSSHGSQSSFGQEVAELIRQYQKEEGARLSAGMSPQRITMLESVEAEKPYQNAVQQTQTRRKQQEAFFQNRPPGRAPAFEKRIESAVSAEKLAQEKLETAQNRQTEVKDALEQISQRTQEGVAPGGSKECFFPKGNHAYATGNPPMKLVCRLC
ncbi:hypothetical protein WDW89_24095, partial [Deltaproteobacteria bacterium TL4]